MGEITAAIVAITLVLLSVFVPVGLHSRHLRPAVPSVRRRRLGLDGPLDGQRAHSLARALRHPAQAAPGAAARRLGWMLRGIDAHGTATSPGRAHGAAWRCSGCCCSPSPSGRSAGVRRRPRPASCRRRTRAPSSSSPAAGRGVGQPNARRGGGARSRRWSAASARDRGRSVSGYCMLDGLAKSNCGFSIVPLLPFEQRDGRAQVQAALARQGPAAGRRSARRWSFPFNCRQSSASAPAAASSTSSSTSRAATRPTSRGRCAALTVAADQDPRLGRGVHHLRGRRRSSSSNIDRDGLQTLGVSVDDLFARLQATLGSATSTTSTCSAAAGRSGCRRDPADRASSPTSTASRSATPRRGWSLRSRRRVRVVGPQAIVRYNNDRR